MARNLLVGATVMVMALLTTSCGTDRVAVDDLAVPDLASDEPIDGAFEVRLDLEIAQIREEVDFDESPDERILWLPDDVDPAEVFAFYDAEFDEYSSEGEPHVSRHHTRATWRNDDQRIVVAVVDATTTPDDADSTPANPSIFLVLFA